MKTDSETYPAMLSLDDKNYILLTKEGTMKIHGSSLKGKHMPIVCDKFRDALCFAVFNKQDVFGIFAEFQDLSEFPVRAFQIRIYPSKTDYKTSTLYSKLLKQVASAGLRVVAGSSLEYVKATDGYKPVVLFSEQDHIDEKYYKNRLAEIASRILFKPTKSLRRRLDGGQKSLGDFKN